MRDAARDVEHGKAAVKGDRVPESSSAGLAVSLNPPPQSFLFAFCMFIFPAAIIEPVMPGAMKKGACQDRPFYPVPEGGGISPLRRIRKP